MMRTFAFQNLARADLIVDAVCEGGAMGNTGDDPISRQSQPNTIGVREVSRLISRIRHRQFCVLVTTSAVSRQAYQEVREDKHPIIFLSGKDIAEILITSGYNTRELLQDFLEREFPKTDRCPGGKEGQ